MNETYTFPTVSEALPFLCSRLLNRGYENGSRNGRVMELLNTQIVITDPVRREVLSVNRKTNVFAQIAETCWVLAGRNDIEWLSAYLPRAKDYSDNGLTWRAGYGPRIRRWEGREDGSGVLMLDQLAYVVDTLRADPLSRQAVIGIWDPAVDTSPGKDKACNDLLQFQSRLGQLHLTVTVRSNDLMWGWSGINTFEWSTLLEIVASLLGLQVGTLTFNIGSLHLYQQHWEKARNISHEEAVYEPIRFTPGRNIRTLEGVDRLLEQWFAWEAKCRTGDVDPSNAEGWPSPLFRSWAYAIAYYWTRDAVWLNGLQGTALGVAIARTPASVLSEPIQRSSSVPVAPTPTTTLSETVLAFYRFAINLHAAKHRSYGDSWKKRGEKLSILANIARKVDRLGVQDLFESTADTWIDLMVYLAKYLCWLKGMEDDPNNVNPLIYQAILFTEEGSTSADLEFEIAGITSSFNLYADNVDLMTSESKREFVRSLLLRVAPFACDVWVAEQDEYKGADLD